LTYATIEDLRRIVDIADDADESVLDYYLAKATQKVIQDIFIRVTDETLTGNIDGVNNTFEVSKVPMADYDGDKVVGTADVTVVAWGDSSDPATKETLTVSQVYGREGKIVLSSAPSSTFDVITADYSYTKHDYIDWEMIELATAYWAAYLYALKEMALIPEQYALGAARFRHSRPYLLYKELYEQAINDVRTGIISRKDQGEVTLYREIMK
jgi:hypothetical protein